MGTGSHRTILVLLSGKPFLTVDYALNEFVDELAYIGKKLLLAENNNTEYTAATLGEVTAKLNNETSIMDVGCLLSDNSEGNIVYKFTTKGNGSQTIRGDSNLVEPLCYTLLFPYGERGWSKHLDNKISFFNYMRGRFKMPEKTIASDSDPPHNNTSSAGSIPVQQGLLRQWTKSTTNPKLLATNRFQLMTRLSQYYQVEQLSRAIDVKLEFQRKQKQFLHGQRTQFEPDVNEDERDDDGGGGACGGGEEDADDEHDGGGPQAPKPKRTYINASFHGSPRHLNDLAHNAITIVTERGPPDFFITGTTNPLWPEIVDRLFPGQSAFDRPDIVTEVFHARLEALIHNLRRGKYFGGREPEFDIRVIEYQHRGLPHFHMVAKMKSMPIRQDKEDILSMIDE